MIDKKESQIPAIIQVSKDEAKKILKTNLGLIQSNISKILESRKISQSELARAIESEQSHINYILRQSKRGITIKVLGRIAQALNVKLTDLVK